jgi:hypothetical protein
MIVITRRAFLITFGEMTFLVVVTGSTGCEKSSVAPSPPTPYSMDLLSKILQTGEHPTAKRVEFGTKGAARVVIRGDINWNFKIGDNVLGLGPDVNPPTTDASKIEVPHDANVIVQGW